MLLDPFSNILRVSTAWDRYLTSIPRDQYHLLGYHRYEMDLCAAFTNTPSVNNGVGSNAPLTLKCLLTSLMLHPPSEKGLTDLFFYDGCKCCQYHLGYLKAICCTNSDPFR